LMDWIDTFLLEEHKIDPDDLDLIRVVETKEEVLEHLERFYHKESFKPNF
ncbi:MAG TPA: TIGR00730 family Rossman fold protein, partial [Flavobacteriaceae bacterium]|nr:TIGR00730 family Rossman fold protein [Flavobacteriaceae bacterium]